VHYFEKNCVSFIYQEYNFLIYLINFLIKRINIKVEISLKTYSIFVENLNSRTIIDKSIIIDQNIVKKTEIKII